MTRFTVNTESGVTFYGIPADTSSEAMERIDTLALVLGINDYSVDAHVDASAELSVLWANGEFQSIDENGPGGQYLMTGKLPEGN